MIKSARSARDRRAAREVLVDGNLILPRGRFVRQHRRADDGSREAALLHQRFHAPHVVVGVSEHAVEDRRKHQGLLSCFAKEDP